MPGALATMSFDKAAIEQSRQREGDTRDAPGILEQATASARVAADTVEDVQELRRAQAYRPLIDLLVERGVDPDTLHHRQPGPFGFGTTRGAFDYAAIWQAAKAQGLDGLPGTQEQFEQDAYRRSGGRDRDLDTIRRGEGVSGTLVQLGGGMAGSMVDPVNAYSMLIPIGGATVFRKVLYEGIANATIEGVQAVDADKRYARLGEEYGAGQAAADIGLAFGAGAAFRGAFEAAPGVARFAYDRTVPLDIRLARELDKLDPGTISDDLLVRAFDAAVPEHLRTPEQELAFSTLKRVAEIDGASPYRDPVDGLAEHRARLDDAIAALEQGGVPGRPTASLLEGGLPPRRSAGHLDGRIVRFFLERGYSEAQARGIAAGIHAESGSRADAVNPASGAYGLGQHLDSRQKELFRRYGRKPTLEQQLEFLDWELRQGGDHGGAAVMAAGDEIAVLDAYIRKFMRPKAGAETDGDLSRGMAALGREGESMFIFSPSNEAEKVNSARLAEQQALGDAAEVRAQNASLASDQAPAFREPPDHAFEPELYNAGVLAAARQVAGDYAIPLGRAAELAQALGVPEPQLRRALDQLVEEGGLRRTAKGQYRRLPRPGESKPEDLLTFVARSGGVSYDGLRPDARTAGALGHDLRNTGHLGRFVPGAGPLLRPAGRSLDEIGELLHEAGYLGPPEVTPRPTESEVIALLDRAAREWADPERRIYAETPPEPRATREDFEGPDAETEAYHAALAAEWARYDRISDAGEAQGVMLMRADVDEIVALMREGLPHYGRIDPDEALDEGAIAPFIAEFVNRKLDDALDDAFNEIEDEIYDLAAREIADPGGQDRAGRAGGAGRAPEPGDAGQGATRGRAGPGAAEEAALDPVASANPRLEDFSDPVGKAAGEQADGLLHDLRALADSGELDRLSFPTGRDGAGESLAEMVARLDADEAAIKALRECL